jgi:hypothetical protein
LVVLLVCGMGFVRLASAAQNPEAGVWKAESAFGDLVMVTDDEGFGEALSAATPLGGDDQGGSLPVHGLSVAGARPQVQPIAAEGQVAFGMRSGTIKRAIHPTGPPLLPVA